MPGRAPRVGPARVDENVDPVGVDALGGLAVRQRAQLDEAIEVPGQSFGDFVVAFGPGQGIAMDLEQIAVVGGQDVGEGAAQGMAAEVGR